MKRLFLIITCTIIINQFGSSCTILDNFNISKLNLLTDTLKQLELADAVYCKEKKSGKTVFSFPLFEAVETSAALTGWLLENGANVMINRQNVPFGLTPLMMAAKSCTYNPEAPTIVKLLLQAGANPLIKTAELLEEDKETALSLTRNITRSASLPAHSAVSCRLVEQLLIEAILAQPSRASNQ